SHTPHASHLQPQHSGYDSAFSPGFQNSQTTAAANVLGNMGTNNKGATETQPAGEFNHAIHYLNKIKARYADDPNTYKQFLDILQTYQREQNHLQDASFIYFTLHTYTTSPNTPLVSSHKSTHKSKSFSKTPLIY